MNLFFWRDRALHDFADAIRPELHAMPAPEPTDATLRRIVASRAAGTRIILPDGAAPAGMRVRRYTAVVAIAAVLLLLVVRPTARQSDGGAMPFISSVGFLGQVAFAGDASPQRAAFAPVRVTNAAGLHPMRLEYSQRTTDINGKPSGAFTLTSTLSATALAGVPAWRLVKEQRASASGDARVELDTVFVARDDLRLLRHVAGVRPYSRNYADIRVQQDLDHNRITGQMTAKGSGVPDARRPIARVLPDDGAPYIADAFAPFYLTAVTLDTHWRGSLSLVGWAVRDDDVSLALELSVIGEEVVDVPAGRFDCWKLTLSFGRHQVWYWVRKSDGLGVRTLDDAEKATRGTRETVLVHG